MTPKEAIEAVLATRAAGKTICPSEAARRLDQEDWRSHMDEIRTAGAALAREGRLVVTQKGKEVDPAAARGPIRYGRPDA